MKSKRMYLFIALLFIVHICFYYVDISYKDYSSATFDASYPIMILVQSIKWILSGIILVGFVKEYSIYSSKTLLIVFSIFTLLTIVSMFFVKGSNFYLTHYILKYLKIIIVSYILTGTMIGVKIFNK